MKRHPKALLGLCSTMIWERFAFYGIRAMLVIYMVEQTLNGGFGWSNSDAISLYSTFMGIAWCTPLLGGYLADRYLGQRLSIWIGGILMASGQFLLAFPGMGPFFAGLSLVALGNGFFKPCLTSMVGGLYGGQDEQRRNSAYSIFYMGINLGIFLAPLICGWAQLTFGFGIAFAATGLGMVLAMGIYTLARRKLPEGLGLRPRPLAHNKARRQPLSQAEKLRIASIVILCVFFIAWYASMEQAGGLMAVFAQQFTDRSIGSWEIPTAWFLALPPFFMVAFAPVLSKLWNRLSLKGKEPSTCFKMAFGCFLSAAAFALMIVATIVAGDGKVASHWHIWFYALLGASEMCVIPVLWATISRVAPAKYLSFLMAMALAAIGLGSKVAGIVGAYIDALGPLQLFWGIGCAMAILGILMILVNQQITRLQESGLQPKPEESLSTR